MIVIFTWKEIILKIGDRILDRFPASCNVRNELNGRRLKNQVVKTIPVTGSPAPYYPRQFPSGIFNITGVEYTNNPEYAPVKIKTNALREVFTWSLDKEGNYNNMTGKIQIDSAYWLHYTKSKTTLGCIKIENYEDVLKFSGIIERYLERNTIVKLEVL